MVFLFTGCDSEVVGFGAHAKTAACVQWNRDQNITQESCLNPYKQHCMYFIKSFNSTTNKQYERIHFQFKYGFLTPTPMGVVDFQFDFDNHPVTWLSLRLKVNSVQDNQLFDILSPGYLLAHTKQSKAVRSLGIHHFIVLSLMPSSKIHTDGQVSNKVHLKCGVVCCVD